MFIRTKISPIETDNPSFNFLQLQNQKTLIVSSTFRPPEGAPPSTGSPGRRPAPQHAAARSHRSDSAGVSSHTVSRRLARQKTTTHAPEC